MINRTSSRLLAASALVLGLFLVATSWAQSPQSPPGASGDQTTVQPEAHARGWSRSETLLASLTIFVLAVFVGFEVITKVPPTLHTPLMSGSNAISGITIVGALLAAGAEQITASTLVGLLAVILAAINVVGGFLVTHRMLSMFRRR
jgi:NAD(P) transhydrogenase subunit alpha